jgi:hypothetical protein
MDLSPQVGGVGHTLYSANNMMLMGSLYSMSEESETIGILIFCLFTDFIQGEYVERGKPVRLRLGSLGVPTFVGMQRRSTWKTIGENLNISFRCRLTAGDFTAYRNISDLLKHKGQSG